MIDVGFYQLKFQSADFLLECSAKYIIKKWKKNQICEQFNRSHDEKNESEIVVSYAEKYCLILPEKKNNSISRGIHLPTMVMTQIGHFYKDWSEKSVTIVGIGHKMVVLDYCNGQANDLHCISWSKWFLKSGKINLLIKSRSKFSCKSFKISLKIHLEKKKECDKIQFVTNCNM